MAPVAPVRCIWLPQRTVPHGEKNTVLLTSTSYFETRKTIRNSIVSSNQYHTVQLTPDKTATTSSVVTFVASLCYVSDSV
ncbi:hypothetical protein J6590_059069 [Homalodisca vitripennis]|nr:hypothetical protein J6590_059069 [Homalodisca vitripennis]